MAERSESLLAAIWLKEHVDSWGAQAPDINEMNEILRRLGRWRSRLLANTFISHQGLRIHGGLFAGMQYIDHATEGAFMPRLLGSYESELHPHFARLAQHAECIIDVGCAEGYYAVGLARRAPQATVYAYDIDPEARAACAELAARNGVADRVVIGEVFEPRTFQDFAGRRTLVLVDAEGAEVDILQPALAPALADMTVIVETHDVYRPGAMAEMFVRFVPTHNVLRIDQQAKTPDMPDWLKALPHLDQLLAVWEWRVAPTPWLVMEPRR
ncbi:MAG: methyltransferase domain-containing protein [Pseudomonadota bacterium]